MKKYLAICAAMLLGASLALAACTPTQNDGPEQGETPEESPGGEIEQELTPVIPGDYHAPTAAELGYALSLLEENGEYIDGQPVGIEVDGLTVEARLDLAMQSAEDKLTMEGAGSYDLCIENSRTGAAVGAGDVRLDAAYTAGEEQESVAVSGCIYHDDAFLYCDVTENGEVHRGKVSYELLPFLLEEISSGMPFEGGVLPLRGMRTAHRRSSRLCRRHNRSLLPLRRRRRRKNCSRRLRRPGCRWKWTTAQGSSSGSTPTTTTFKCSAMP